MALQPQASNYRSDMTIYKSASYTLLYRLPTPQYPSSFLSDSEIIIGSVPILASSTSTTSILINFILPPFHSILYICFMHVCHYRAGLHAGRAGPSCRNKKIARPMHGLRAVVLVSCRAEE
ncbi:hypothetical protein RND81_11G178400 [Saponaria officinalis]|uniref:Uncharacterized protein n=1 Tax=Saponaria officinalis TaxID=3572 RepID=A0AAW1HMK7_SAPOF